MGIKTFTPKQLNPPNIHSMLSKDANDLRRLLIDLIIDMKQPLVQNDINKCCQNSNFDSNTILEELAAKGLVAVNDEEAVTGVYPVSALPTRHSVMLSDGRSFHAMCAIDSLGVLYEFDMDLTISSSCKYCDSNISIKGMDGKITTVKPPTTHALHVDLRRYKDWAESC